MPTKLILFDIDGTLVMTQGAGRDATREAMLEIFGTSATIDTHKFGGKTDWFTLIEQLGDYGIEPDEIAQRMPAYTAAVGRHLAQIIPQRKVSALPGAIEAVQHLRQRENVVLGVITGNVASTAPIKLRAAGINPDWFAFGVYGDEAIERDDLPALALQRAAALTGQTFTPSDTVIIGDTVMDIQCTRALGREARCIIVSTGFSTRDELLAAQPDVLLDDLTTLLDVL